MIVRSAVFGVILSVLSAIPASAQDERGFVRGLVGVTFGTAETSMLFGGGGGFSVGKGVQIVGEFGRMNDVLPEDLKDQLDFITALLTAQLGVPVSLDVTAPAFYGMGGARYTVPRGRVRPFGEVQAGWAHISFDIDAEVAGLDLSREVEDAADLESGDDFLLAFGSGIVYMFTNSVGFEAGYRYHRIFTDDPAINSNAFYGAVHFALP